VADVAIRRLLNHDRLSDDSCSGYCSWVPGCRRIEVWRTSSAEENERRLVKVVYTNADGRTDRPVLEDTEFGAGVYELVFGAGSYFAAQNLAGTENPFLNDVPIRFGVADPSAHYHVPLLMSPWAYSTYRGS
jgi:5-hydroxyisourate hydrolase